MAVPRNHRLVAAAQVTLADIVDENFGSLPSGSALPQMLGQEAARLGSAISIRIRVGSLDAPCRMVHAGLGIAVVPHLVGELNASSLDLLMVPFAGASFPDRSFRGLFT
jgi:DNA-binding transcriptional LysR family regulator